MSSFIMFDRSHAAIADTLWRILNSGFNRFGFDAPDSLHNALKDCRDRYGYYSCEQIYNRIYQLNARATGARYGVDASPVPDMPAFPSLVEPRQCINYHEKLLPWHYTFCKLLDCLIYQCSEDATRNDPLLLALIDFSRVYKSFLVVNTEEYSAAPWGSF